MLCSLNSKIQHSSIIENTSTLLYFLLRLLMKTAGHLEMPRLKNICSSSFVKQNKKVAVTKYKDLKQHFLQIINEDCRMYGNAKVSKY